MEFDCSLINLYLRKVTFTTHENSCENSYQKYTDEQADASRWERRHFYANVSTPAHKMYFYSELFY